MNGCHDILKWVLDTCNWWTVGNWILINGLTPHIKSTFLCIIINQRGPFPITTRQIISSCDTQAPIIIIFFVLQEIITQIKLPPCNDKSSYEWEPAHTSTLLFQPQLLMFFFLCEVGVLLYSFKTFQREAVSELCAMAALQNRAELCFLLSMAAKTGFPPWLGSQISLSFDISTICIHVLQNLHAKIHLYLLHSLFSF